jgi:hypothetical protein
MSNLPVFLTGLASGPVIAVAAWMLAQAVRAVIRWWPKRPPLVIHDDDFRVRNAAAILTARKVASIRLPGSVVLCWRSTVPWGHPTNDVVNGIRVLANPSPPAAET